MSEQIKPRVVLFEDNPDYIDALRLWFELEGIELVVVATTMDSAIDTISRLKDSEVDVALVDGNLTKGQVDGTEGAEIIKSIKERYPNLPTIGISADSDVKGADYNSGKTGRSGDMNNLIGLIREMFDPASEK